MDEWFIWMTARVRLMHGTKDLMVGFLESLLHMSARDGCFFIHGWEGPGAMDRIEIGWVDVDWLCGCMDKEMYASIYVWMDRLLKDGCMDGSDEWMYSEIDSCVDAWVDGSAVVDALGRLCEMQVCSEDLDLK